MLRLSHVLGTYYTFLMLRLSHVLGTSEMLLMPRLSHILGTSVAVLMLRFSHVEKNSFERNGGWESQEQKILQEKKTAKCYFPLRTKHKVL